MSVLETLLWFGIPVIGIFLLVYLAVLGPKQAKRKRYKVGDAWNYEPLWWTANPEGAHLPAPHTRAVAGERGGARGSW